MLEFEDLVWIFLCTVPEWLSVIFFVITLRCGTTRVLPVSDHGDSRVINQIPELLAKAGVPHSLEQEETVEAEQTAPSEGSRRWIWPAHLSGLA